MFFFFYSVQLGNRVRRAEPPDQVGIEEEGVPLQLRVHGDRLRGREEDLQGQGRWLGRGRLPGQVLPREAHGRQGEVRERRPGVRQVRREHRVGLK